MLHVVTKPIPGPGGKIPSGQLVNPDEWKNLKALVSLRYLRPATAEDLAGIEEVEVNEHGISRINLLEPKPRKRATIKKSKRA